MANRHVQIKHSKLFINNEFVESESGKKYPIINPSDESVVAQVSEGDKADIDQATRAAKAAFEYGSAWRELHPTERASLLLKLAALVERDAAKIANIQSLENGKPFALSLGESMMAASIYRYYAGWCDKFHGTTVPTDDGTLVMTRKEPIGVVGLITPWNVPIIMIAFKWGPALATGCTLVLKPAEQTSLCALYMASLAKEAGFPPGVINVVPGFGLTAGKALSEHSDIVKVAFTGSSAVGRQIMIAAGNTNLKRVTLELGGKSPLVICDDVNVDEAVQIAHDAIFFNSGQVCLAASRTFVHAKIYDEFVKKSVELALKRKLGDPFDPATQQGPQVNKAIFDRVMSYIAIGQKEGAKLETGGKQWGNVGYFIEPTIFSNVTEDMTIAKEEIFGPVQIIFKFDSMSDVIKKANNTVYGLAAGILTNDLNKAIKFSQAVESGNVWVNQYANVMQNAPFGGYKQSGIGRELGAESLENYLETKTISIKLSSTI